MLGTPFSLRVLDAAARTLHAYDDLIAAPGNHYLKWRGYGNFPSCHLCVAMAWPAKLVGGTNLSVRAFNLKAQRIRCYFCPLRLSDTAPDYIPTVRAGNVPCAEGMLQPSLDRLSTAILMAVGESSPDALREVGEAAEDRRNHLLARFFSNGVDIHILKRAEVWFANPMLREVL